MLRCEVVLYSSRRIIETISLLHSCGHRHGGYSISLYYGTFLTVIIPNIWPGIISAALLTFATVMGEFTVAELFSIYTFPIYLDVTTQNDAHKAAALTVLSFTLTLLCVLAIVFLLRGRRGARKDEQLDLVAAK